MAINSFTALSTSGESYGWDCAGAVLGWAYAGGFDAAAVVAAGGLEAAAGWLAAVVVGFGWSSSSFAFYSAAAGFGFLAF